MNAGLRVQIKGSWLIPPAHASGKCVALGEAQSRPARQQGLGLSFCKLPGSLPLLVFFFFGGGVSFALTVSRGYPGVCSQVLCGQGQGWQAKQKLVLGPGCHFSSSWGAMGLGITWGLPCPGELR